ncbi:MAG: hypothetical protein QF858_02345 [Candidatus Pacebacteria bacterium]|jgi:hypothetical protein|nr:hypothetical protein [Candidatus Paceibacterota bacterium]|tara:strand:- start:242 stop:490 length:249 start_codon:yes stop_codon:yes gene_type:complete
MIVKFIITIPGRVLFGDKHYRGDYHSNIASKYGVSSEVVRGGGLADLELRKIFGTSYGFGPYDPKFAQELLPDWQIESPSDY